MIAAEQKARSTYDNILRLCKDYPDVYEPIKFLRAREVVHFQRFGEALRLVQDKLDEKNFYAFNPAFDRSAPCVDKKKCNCEISWGLIQYKKGLPCNGDGSPLISGYSVL